MNGKGCDVDPKKEFFEGSFSMATKTVTKPLVCVIVAAAPALVTKNRIGSILCFLVKKIQGKFSSLLSTHIVPNF